MNQRSSQTQFLKNVSALPSEQTCLACGQPLVAARGFRLTSRLGCSSCGFSSGEGGSLVDMIGDSIDLTSALFKRLRGAL